jgi:hypothetical protein
VPRGRAGKEHGKCRIDLTTGQCAERGCGERVRFSATTVQSSPNQAKSSARRMTCSAHGVRIAPGVRATITKGGTGLGAEVKDDAVDAARCAARESATKRASWVRNLSWSNRRWGRSAPVKSARRHK